jgi:hypothetical protein
MIYAHMLSNDTKTFIPKLAGMVAVYNSLHHTGIKQTPMEVHNNRKVGMAVGAQIQKQAIKSKKRGRQFKRPPIHVGDTVRVALIHQALEKPVTFWTTELFLVTQIIEPAKEWDAASYVLHDGRKITRERLQKVNKLKLVQMRETEAPKERNVGKKKTKDAVVPRAQPQRERAPSSMMRDSYVDL